jgi:hypothetical protein
MKTECLAAAVALLVATIASAQQPSATNSVRTAEDRLLGAFPELLWSRSDLEFIFEKRAEVRVTLEAGGNQDAAALKLAKDLERRFTSPEKIRVFTDGWKMSGKLHQSTVNFSKDSYAHASIPCEAQVLFDGQKLISLGLWVKGDKEFAALYRALVEACGSSGEREVSGKNDAQIKWSIPGTNTYQIVLSRRDDERGVDFSIKHLKP